MRDTFQETIDYTARYELLVGLCRSLSWAVRGQQEKNTKIIEQMIERKLVEWEEIERP